MKTQTRRAQRGAGMTEYVILVGLIAMAAIVPIKAFSWRLEDAVFAASLEVNAVEEQKETGQPPSSP